MLQGGRPDVVQEAMRYLGTPYRYGGRLPYDVDCSLLVQAAFGARGARLPRTAAEQFEVGQAVNYTELLPGDRLYFVSTSGRINHTGIYIGSGRFVHASSRKRCVAIDALGDRLYWSRFVGARRS
jgi:cell wall-associated NlpC family hydrolase